MERGRNCQELATQGAYGRLGIEPQSKARELVRAILTLSGSDELVGSVCPAPAVADLPAGTGRRRPSALAQRSVNDDRAMESVHP